MMKYEMGKGSTNLVIPAESRDAQLADERDGEEFVHVEPHDDRTIIRGWLGHLFLALALGGLSLGSFLGLGYLGGDL